LKLRQRVEVVDPGIGGPRQILKGALNNYRNSGYMKNHSKYEISHTSRDTRIAYSTVWNYS